MTSIQTDSVKKDSIKVASIKTACVYCGSSAASDPVYDQPTIALGTALAKAGITLTYGGGSPGLMGKVANACMEAGGEVIGIIPESILKLEARHNELTELIVVDNMHTRKRMMAERADAFVVMPGGLGTLDEMFEILTWRYLGIHDKPVIIANILGYWDPLLALMDHMMEKKFLREPHMKTFVVARDVDEVMAILTNMPPAPQNVESEKI